MLRWIWSGAVASFIIFLRYILLLYTSHITHHFTYVRYFFKFCDAGGGSQPCPPPRANGPPRFPLFSAQSTGESSGPKNWKAVSFSVVEMWPDVFLMMGVKISPLWPLQKRWLDPHRGTIVAQAAHMQPDNLCKGAKTWPENVLVTLETAARRYFKQASTLNACTLDILPPAKLTQLEWPKVTCRRWETCFFFWVWLAESPPAANLACKREFGNSFEGFRVNHNLSLVIFF